MDIQDKYMTVVVGKYSRRKLLLVDSLYIELLEPVLNHDQIINETLLIQQLKVIRQKLSRHCVYHIAINQSQILQQTLTLPDVDLSHQDRQWFVTAALSRLFPLPAKELAVDYPESGNELVITVARKEHIEQWQRIFKQAGLTLDKITADLVNHDYLQLAEPFYAAESLVRHALQQGINLLPWRAGQRRQFYCRTVCLLLVYFMLSVSGLMAVYHVTDIQQQKAKQQIEQLTLISEQLNQQMINILQLNQSVIEVRQQLQQQLQPFFNLLILLQNLMLVAESVPIGLWLEQLKFDNQSLLLKGNSFLYPSIMIFIQRFDQQDFIQNSQLQAILHQNSLLKFHLKVVLSKNIERHLNDK